MHYTIIRTFGGSDSTTGTKVVWSETTKYKDRYNYQLTQENDDSIHADPPLNFVVHLLEDIDDPYMLRIYGKFGELVRDYHWRIISPGVVEFVSFQLGSLDVGDNIWFALYEED